MDKLMGDMDVKPSGDVDHDFAAMMIPHHQGAIDMGPSELRYGAKRTVAPYCPGNHRRAITGDRGDVAELKSTRTTV
jgi:hypothetical protein